MLKFVDSDHGVRKYVVLLERTSYVPLRLRGLIASHVVYLQK
jgi:hypothetical protein